MPVHQLFYIHFTPVYKLFHIRVSIVSYSRINCFIFTLENGSPIPHGGFDRVPDDVRVLRDRLSGRQPPHPEVSTP